MIRKQEYCCIKPLSHVQNLKLLHFSKIWNLVNVYCRLYYYLHMAKESFVSSLKLSDVIGHFYTGRHDGDTLIRFHLFNLLAQYRPDTLNVCDLIRVASTSCYRFGQIVNAHKIKTLNYRITENSKLNVA